MKEQTWDEIRTMRALAELKIELDRTASFMPSEAPQPTFVRSADFGRGHGIVHIPAGYGNRKARRADKAKQRREAWHAFKAGRREGMARSLALKALADPSWLAQQILEQEERHRRSGGGQ